MITKRELQFRIEELERELERSNNRLDRLIDWVESLDVKIDYWGRRKNSNEEYIDED